jgi:hypothetical protein
LVWNFFIVNICVNSRNASFLDKLDTHFLDLEAEKLANFL